jgi:hypothetical protein
MSKKIFIIGPSKYLSRHFSSIHEYYGSSLVYIDNYNSNHIISQKPDLVILPDEHWCQLGNIVSLCKDYKILTLQLMDGILEWRRIWDYSNNNRKVDGVLNPLNQPAFADKIACLGYRDFKILESWGNIGKCELVGIPRLKEIQNSIKDYSQVNSSKRRILICTAKTPAFTEEQERNVLESLEDLKAFFLRRKDIEITWRITGDYGKRLNIENTLNDFSGQEIHQLISQVDAVITTPSTTLLEAMLLKRPVALLDYHNTPHYFETAWTISAKCHVSNVVDELVKPPICKMEYQEFLLKEQLFTFKDPTARLIELIDKMLIYKDNYQELPCSILDNSFSQSLILKSEISSYYPDLSWVDKLNTKELKLQLAAARGTIEILETKNDYLQKTINSIPFYKIVKNIKKILK